MDSSASTPEVRDGADDRANELYWGSNLSVNQIAEALDLSKGALYEIIRPLPASVACPACGMEAVHPNRTAHERGLIVCLDCGWEGAADEAAPISLPPPAPHGRRPPSQAGRTEGTMAEIEGQPVRPGLTVPILIGAAVGAALMLWAMRRR